MKKMIITIIALLVLFPVSAQKQVIDMDSFKGYLSEYSQAEIIKDKAKLNELKARKGREYDRGTIAWRVIKSYRNDHYQDKEACAFLAAYYEADYYKKRRRSDLAKAVKFYEEALYNMYSDEKKQKEAQVKLHYARFLVELESNSLFLVDELVKAGALKNDYYDYREHKDVVYSNKELQSQLVSKIARLIEESGDAGYDAGAYYWARTHRQYGMPSAYKPRYTEPKTLDGRWVLMHRYVKKYYEMIKQCGYPDYPLRNEDVVKYYTIAATGGKPQYQMEFAEYLLRTMCEGWKVSWTSEPGVHGRPFVQEYKRWIFDGHEFVRNESADSEIEEQVTYWYLLAAKQDYPPAMVDLAFCMFYKMHPYDDSLHYSELVHWLEKASNLGDPTAMYNLSVVRLIKDGEENTHQDSLDAIYWARRGADSGDIKCQHLLGRYYYYGVGVRIDKHEALRWFKAAADKGSRGAAFMAGNLYTDKSVGNDMAMAVKYYELAEMVPEAYTRLSELYAKGEGVIMDKQKARDYEQKAGGEAFPVFAKYNDYSYYSFEPGLCFYTYNYYGGWEVEPSLIKQAQL